MPDRYQSVPTVQSSSFYRQYHSRVVLPQLLSRTANPRGTDFYRRYYTGVVLPELLDHPILVRRAAIARPLYGYSSKLDPHYILCIPWLDTRLKSTL